DANNVFTLGTNNGLTNLQFALNQIDSNLISEIGIFKVDDATGRIGNLTPGSAEYNQAALDRASILFSALPDGTRPNGFGIDKQDGVLGDLQAGDRFLFYFVRGGSAESAGQRPPGGNLFVGFGTTSLQVTDRGSGQFSLGFNEDGDASFNDIVVQIQQTGTLPPIGVGQEQFRGPELVDLLDANNPQNIPSGNVTANFNVFREARFNNVVGLYRIDDAQGTVNGIAPGQAGYAQAAIARRATSIEISTEHQTTRAVSGLLQGNVLYAPFIIVNATPEQFLEQNPTNQLDVVLARGGILPTAYFSFFGANPDQADHIRILGNNTFGFEDMPSPISDFDYNDLIVEIDITV
ncbi:DUF4114 domain-containing protein, partial [Lusitaniella coriacea LEGE 07157]